MSEHQHSFEVKYRRHGEGIEIIEPTKCNGCDQLIHATYDGYRLRFTVLTSQETATYSIDMVEREYNA